MAEQQPGEEEELNNNIIINNNNNSSTEKDEQGTTTSHLLQNTERSKRQRRVSFSDIIDVRVFENDEDEVSKFLREMGCDDGDGVVAKGSRSKNSKDTRLVAASRVRRRPVKGSDMSAMTLRGTEILASSGPSVSPLVGRRRRTLESLHEKGLRCPSCKHSGSKTPKGRKRRGEYSRLSPMVIALRADDKTNLLTSTPSYPTKVSEFPRVAVNSNSAKSLKDSVDVEPVNDGMHDRAEAFFSTDLCNAISNGNSAISIEESAHTSDDSHHASFQNQTQPSFHVNQEDHQFNLSKDPADDELETDGSKPRICDSRGCGEAEQNEISDSEVEQKYGPNHQSALAEVEASLPVKDCKAVFVSGFLASANSLRQHEVISPENGTGSIPIQDCISQVRSDINKDEDLLTVSVEDQLSKKDLKNAECVTLTSTDSSGVETPQSLNNTIQTAGTSANIKSSEPAVILSSLLTMSGTETAHNPSLSKNLTKAVKLYSRLSTSLKETILQNGKDLQKEAEVSNFQTTLGNPDHQSLQTEEGSTDMLKMTLNGAENVCSPGPSVSPLVTSRSTVESLHEKGLRNPSRKHSGDELRVENVHHIKSSNGCKRRHDDLLLMNEDQTDETPSIQHPPHLQQGGLSNSVILFKQPIDTNDEGTFRMKKWQKYDTGEDRYYVCWDADLGRELAAILSSLLTMSGTEMPHNLSLSKNLTKAVKLYSRRSTSLKDTILQNGKGLPKEAEVFNFQTTLGNPDQSLQTEEGSTDVLKTTLNGVENVCSPGPSVTPLVTSRIRVESLHEKGLRNPSRKHSGDELRIENVHHGIKISNGCKRRRDDLVLMNEDQTDETSRNQHRPQLQQGGLSNSMILFKQPLDTNDEGTFKMKKRQKYDTGEDRYYVCWDADLGRELAASNLYIQLAKDITTDTVKNQLMSSKNKYAIASNIFSQSDECVWDDVGKYKEGDLFANGRATDVNETPLDANSGDMLNNVDSIGYHRSDNSMSRSTQHQKLGKSLPPVTTSSSTLKMIERIDKIEETITTMTSSLATTASSIANMTSSLATMASSVANMASSIANMANSREVYCDSKPKRVDIDDLYDTVSTIPELSDDTFLRVCNWLMEDESKFRFLKKLPEDKRKSYVLRFMR